VELSFFVPLIMGHGGNTGSQAVTTVIRALALKHISSQDLAKVVLKEAGAGCLMGGRRCSSAALWLCGGRLLCLRPSTPGCRQAQGGDPCPCPRQAGLLRAEAAAAAGARGAGPGLWEQPAAAQPALVLQEPLQRAAGPPVGAWPHAHSGARLAYPPAPQRRP
jgi:hypothetical protein